MNQSERWPALPLAEWKDTYATLHMWTQIVGKVRLALCAPTNHWWSTALYVTARGLTTSPIPYEKGIFEVHFDFINHVLEIQTSLGETRTFHLVPRTVAAFYEEFMAALHLQRSQQLYQNPFVNMAYTFMEPLPVGLIITLISAAILRRKAPVEPTAAPAVMTT